MIKILFFASLREKLNCANLDFELGELKSLGQLRERLSERGDDWRVALADSHLQVSLNQQISIPDAVLKCGDEVAFFPPVTGG